MPDTPATPAIYRPTPNGDAPEALVVRGPEGEESFVALIYDAPGIDGCDTALDGARTIADLLNTAAGLGDRVLARRCDYVNKTSGRRCSEPVTSWADDDAALGTMRFCCEACRDAYGIEHPEARKRGPRRFSDLKPGERAALIARIDTVCAKARNDGALMSWDHNERSVTIRAHDEEGFEDTKRVSYDRWLAAEAEPRYTGADAALWHAFNDSRREPGTKREW